MGEDGERSSVYDPIYSFQSRAHKYNMIFSLFFCIKPKLHDSLTAWSQTTNIQQNSNRKTDNSKSQTTLQHPQSHG